MQLRTVSLAELDALEVDLLAVPVFGTGDAIDFPELTESLAAVAREEGSDLSAKDGRVVVSRAGEGSGPRRIAFIGAGKSVDDLDAEGVRRLAGRAVRVAEGRGLASVAVVLPADAAAGVEASARAAAEGLVLAAWRFRELKTGAGDDEAPTEVGEGIVVVPASALDEARAAVEVGAIAAEAENFARTLQSRPGNIATPLHLASEARRIADETGLKVDILGPDRLREERMNTLLAVSQGSAQEPRLIVLRHDGGEDDERPLVLVGKGLTFDSGGISIKPALGMESMKFDMSGGAAVLAALWAIARLGLRRNVVGIVPSSENLLSGAAVKPGDVVTTRNGRTVEVINTDAEGRLILCDALDYAVEMEPEAVVDCATLTGAAVIGLGHHASPVMGNDDDLVAELRAAGDRTGERCWPFPMYREYRRQLDSETADLKNVGGRPAGTITAGWYLREFVGEVSWAHLDVAGTAYGEADDLPYRRKGGYGVPTRLLIEWVRSRAA